MSDVSNTPRFAAAMAALIACTSFFHAAHAQTPPASAPTAPPSAKQAIEVRKAVYTLIGANFRPIGDVLQGRAQYDAAEIQKRLARVAFLTELANEAFPEFSNTGLPDTRAKALIWSERAAFDQRLKEFQEHARALVQISAKEQGATEAFKKAAGALAQDCKECHDKYREK